MPVIEVDKNKRPAFIDPFDDVVSDKPVRPEFVDPFEAAPDVSRGIFTKPNLTPIISMFDNPKQEADKVKSSISNGIYFGIEPNVAYDFHDILEKEKGLRNIDIQKLKGTSTLGKPALPKQTGEAEKPDIATQSARTVLGGLVDTAKLPWQALRIYGGLSEMIGGAQSITTYASEKMQDIETFKKGLNLGTPDEIRKAAPQTLDEAFSFKAIPWWINSVLETGTSMAPTIAVGGAFAALGKPIVGLLSGGVIGGLMESENTYNEAKKKGWSNDDAAVVATEMMIASGVLNSLSLSRMLKKLPPNLAGKIFNLIGTGAVEYVTELAEEPSEALILQEGIQGAIDATKQAAIPLLPVFLTGVAGGIGGAEITKKTMPLTEKQQQIIKKQQGLLGDEWRHITGEEAQKSIDRVSNMPLGVEAVYEGMIDGLTATGMSEEKANAEAIQAIIQTEEGREYIQNVVNVAEEAAQVEALTTAQPEITPEQEAEDLNNRYNKIIESDTFETMTDDEILQELFSTAIEPPVPSEAQKQAAPSPLTKQAFISKIKGKAEAKDINTWVLRKGGINYEAEHWKGELRDLRSALNQGKRMGYGNKLIKSKGAYTLDQLALMAKDEGFLTEATPQALLDAMHQRKASIKAAEEFPEPSAPKAEVDPVNLKEGDKVFIDGEEFRHRGFDEKGNILLKDGLEYSLDIGDKIEVDATPEGKPIIEKPFLKVQEASKKAVKPTQLDLAGAKTGLEGKLPSEEIKGQTALEQAVADAKTREAQKGQGDLLKEQPYFEHNGIRFITEDKELGGGKFKDLRYWNGKTWEFIESKRGYGNFSSKDLNRITENIKSTTKPLTEITEGEAKLAVRKAKPFYSQLQKTLEAKMPNKSAAQTVRNIIKDVKQDEVKWSGIEDFLQGKLVVDKQELLDYLRANEVEVKEVEKGDERRRLSEKLDQLDAELQKEEINAEDLAFLEAEHERLSKEYREKYEDTGLSIGADTKFHQYQTPGGKNYKELLLTLPEENFTDSEIERWQKLNDIPIKEMSAGEQVEFNKLQIKRDKFLKILNSYRSSHWDEPNVLAHVRMNDRVDADGKKVLFIEEIQSDWHQEGKRKGYKTSEGIDPDIKEYTQLNRQGASTDELLDILTDRYNLSGPDYDSEIDAIARQQLSGVPSAPFSKTWHELVLKRMLRYAAENGYDKIAWTTGEMQAERYDLSKQVSLIRYFKDGDKFNVSVYAKETGQDIEGIPQKMDISEIEKYLGKEIAEKMSKGEGQKQGNTFALEGQDLKVGGEGMKGFYDKILPNFLNKYGKKWGARVGEIEIKTKEVVVANTGVGWEVLIGGESRGVYSTKKVAEKEARLFTPKHDTVSSIGITPSMKESVLYEGQPMFNLGKPSALDIKEADDVIKNVFARAYTILGKEVVKGGFESPDAILNRLSTDVRKRALSEHGLKMSDKFTVLGLYEHKHTMTGNKLEHTITLSTELKNNPKELKRTSFHEPFHGIIEIIEAMAKEGDPYAQHILGVMEKEFTNPQRTWKEEASEAFADFGMGKTPETLSAKVRAIFERIMAFFRQLGDYLAGRGITSKAEVNSFFEKVWTGEFADRTAGGRERTALSIDEFADFKQSIESGKFGTREDIETSDYAELLKKDYNALSDKERNIVNNLMADEGMLSIKDIDNQTRKTMSEWTFKEVIESDAEIKAMIIKSVRAAREAFKAGNKAGVEEQKQHVVELFVRAKDKLKLKEAISGLKKTAEKLSESPSVSAEYRNKIKELIGQYELKGHTEETIEELKATQEYIDRANAKGEDVEIPQRILDKLQILGRIPKDQLTIDVVNGLKSEIELLGKLGKTKWSSKQALYEAEKEARKEVLLNEASPINSFEAEQEPIGAEPRAWIERFFKLRNFMQKNRLSLRPIDGIADITGMKAMKATLDVDFNIYLTYNDKAFNEWINITKDFTQGQYEKIGAYAIAQQKGGIERLENSGRTKSEIEAIKLADKEMKAYQFVRDKFEAEFPSVRKYALDVYNEDVGQVDNYVSFMSDYTQMSDLEMWERFGQNSYDTGGRKTKTVEQGFRESRANMSKIKLEMNIDKIFRRHMDDVAYMLTMGRDIKQYFEIVNTTEMRGKLGDVGSLAWLQWLDLMARKGGSEGAKRIAFLDTVRRNMGAGILAYRISSFMIQVTSFADTIATIGGEYATKGASHIATSQEWRSFITDNFPEIRKAIGDDIAFREFGNAMFGKLTQKGFAPLQYLDGLMRATAAAGAYQKLADAKGIEVNLQNPDKTLIQEATRLMRDSQGSSFFKDQPLAITTNYGLTGNRSLNKMILQFQSFMLNRWENIERQIWRAGIKERDFGKAFMSFFWLFIVAASLEEGIRRGVRAVINLATGDVEEEKSFEGQVALQAVQSIPLAGQIISSATYASNPVPVIKAMEDSIGGVGSVIYGKQADTKLRGAVRALGAVGSLAGVPGSSQAAQIANKALKDE